MKKIVIIMLFFISIFICIPTTEAKEVGVTVLSIENNFDDIDLDISNESMTCAKVLGPNILKLVGFAFNVLRVAGSIIAVVNGMLSIMSAVNSGNQGDLNKAIRKCIWMAVILVLIIMIPTLVKTIGNLFGFDTTCIG